eukprot:SAG22_NODE_9040_length_613_cov_1.161479_1_plen_129_part_01
MREVKRGMTSGRIPPRPRPRSRWRRSARMGAVLAKQPARLAIAAAFTAAALIGALKLLRKKRKPAAAPAGGTGRQLVGGGDGRASDAGEASGNQPAAEPDGRPGRDKGPAAAAAAAAAAEAGWTCAQCN